MDARNPTGKATVLVVDDTPDNLYLLSGLLKDEYQVKVANSGEKALKIAAEHPPDLILLDVMMPGMDGLEVCRQLKNNPVTDRIPVIFVTAKTEEFEEELGLNLGAVDYITKPFSVPITMARIRNQIRLKQQADLLESIALVDALTHIPNRRRFDEAIEAEWQRAATEKTELSLLMIDIDHFKQYNDHYGHRAGDTCLQSLAGALLAGVTRPGELVARYGGEEFVVILSETGLEGAVQTARRLCQSICDLKLPHAHSAVASFVTVSIGCATMIPSEAANSSKALFDLADKMLYQAKNSGRNRVCWDLEASGQDER
jgi:diguanylate cyclase (GGDEF)-like protein